MSVLFPRAVSIHGSPPLRRRATNGHPFKHDGLVSLALRNNGPGDKSILRYEIACDDFHILYRKNVFVQQPLGNAAL